MPKNNDPNKILENIAENMRRLRKEKSLSQNELAWEADIDRTYIGYLENMKRNVSIVILCKVAHALDIDVEELLKDNKAAIN